MCQMYIYFIMNLEQHVEELQNENIELKTEIEDLKNRLKKYTSPDRNKRWYQKNKEELKKKDYYKTVYDPTKKPSKDKKKEYNKRYREKRKLEKLEKKK